MNGIPNWRAPTFEEVEDIPVGSRVRSYDFEFRDDCYVEGFVEAIEERWGCLRFTIRCDISASEGKRRRVDPTKSVVYPPANGVMHATGGFCNSVRLVRGE
jgi:hypothetical protein